MAKYKVNKKDFNQALFNEFNNTFRDQIFPWVYDLVMIRYRVSLIYDEQRGKIFATEEDLKKVTPQIIEQTVSEVMNIVLKHGDIKAYRDKVAKEHGLIQIIKW